MRMLNCATIRHCSELNFPLNWDTFEKWKLKNVVVVEISSKNGLGWWWSISSEQLFYIIIICSLAVIKYV